MLKGTRPVWGKLVVEPAERPHQGMENELLVKETPAAKGRKKPEPPPDVVRLGEIECRQRLGGLLKHYRRKAA